MKPCALFVILLLAGANRHSQPVLWGWKGADVVFAVGTVRVVGVIEVDGILVIVFDLEVKVTRSAVALVVGRR